MEITKIPNGFRLEGKDTDFLFNTQEAEIISEEQVHIPTDHGKMLLDLSVTIEGQSFETIEDFIGELYK
jgi:hypothetical protein